MPCSTTAGPANQLRRGIRRLRVSPLALDAPPSTLNPPPPSPFDLDSDAFVTEVKKLWGKKKPLSAAGLRSLRDEHARSIEPASGLAAESAALERRVSDLVNEAYGLTPEEVALMWRTAPPRMPLSGPMDAPGSSKVTLPKLPK